MGIHGGDPRTVSGMTVRPAKFADIPRLIEIAQDALSRSRHASRGRVVPEYAKRTAMSAIKNHGQGTCCFVGEAKGSVEAVIVGVTDWFYGACDFRYATDYFFYATRQADPRDAGRLASAFEKWALQAPNVVEIKPMVNGAILGMDWKMSARIWRRRGYVQDGASFHKEIPK